jgi:hypothetical protein
MGLNPTNLSLTHQLPSVLLTQRFQRPTTMSTLAICNPSPNIPIVIVVGLGARAPQPTNPAQVETNTNLHHALGPLQPKKKTSNIRWNTLDLISRFRFYPTTDIGPNQQDK